MKVNISTLMNLIKELEKNLNNTNCVIRTLAISTSVEELDGRTNVVEDNFESFNLKLKQMEKDTNELSRLKAILYEKNNTFKLSDGRSIQHAIVDNTNLRKLKLLYEQLLLFKNSKKRVTEVTNSYFECKTLNFNIADIEKKLEEIDETIQKTDFEISKLNSIEFDI